MNDDLKALAEAGYAWEIADAPILHADLNLVDMAHVITLHGMKAIPESSTRALLGAILDLHSLPISTVGYDPTLGEMYSSREHYFKKVIGDNAGWLRAGRTRREAVRTAFRMVLRRQLLELVAASSSLAEALSAKGAEHVNTLMPDYTYLQPAQPTTFGHYLSSFTDPILRDVQRLMAELPHINASLAGSGAANGSSLIKDRASASALLGFAAPIEHIRDAMWQSDPFAHLLFCATSLGLTQDRLAEDLEIFTSSEFDFLSLSDEMVRPSVLMPQKRNPYALSVIRGTVGILIGRLTGQLAIAKAPSARSDTYIYAYGEVPRALNLSINITRLSASVIRGLRVNTTRMKAALQGSFTESADLAALVMEIAGLNYQDSHAIVAGAIARAKGENREVCAADLHSELEQSGSAAKPFNESDLRAKLDPIALIASRDSLGGAAPEVVTSMTNSRLILAIQMRKEAESQLIALESIEARIIDRARQIIGA